MRDYFYGKFPEQLRQLELRPANRVIRENVDPLLTFFGGRDWQSVREDLGRIPAEDRARFVLSLFMIVLTDQAIYRYFRDSYPRWREKTAFPKFGWSGFGTHNESPMKLLCAPEREQVLRAAELTALLPEFVSFWTEETADLFQREYPEIPVEDYFNRVRNDSAWRAANEGTVVAELKRLLEKEPHTFGGV
jgi:hypothetical protein